MLQLSWAELSCAQPLTHIAVYTEKPHRIESLAHAECDAKRCARTAVCSKKNKKRCRAVCKSNVLCTPAKPPALPSTTPPCPPAATPAGELKIPSPLTVRLPRLHPHRWPSILLPVLLLNTSPDRYRFRGFPKLGGGRGVGT